jgi:hypothetical protein
MEKRSRVEKEEGGEKSQSREREDGGRNRIYKNISTDLMSGEIRQPDRRESLPVFICPLIDMVW